MYRFIQRHGKKLLAVFTAVLMITFALPSATNFSGGGSDVVGKIDGEKIKAPELFRAHQAWELMSRTPYIDPRQPDRLELSMTQAMLGPAAVAAIRENPILFLLLQKEAQRMGVGLSADLLNQALVNMPGLKTGDPDRDEDLKNAFAQVLLVQQAFARAAGALKISEPVIDLHLAGARQSITLTTAEFTTAKYTENVRPSAEQLKAQFEQYSDTIRGAVDANNSFGFGYKYPDRVKLQYISISRPAVRNFVETNSAPNKPKDPYEWEVEAQKYYRQHQAEYPTTRPAPTTATTQAATLPAGPTTRPFAEVREEVIKRLIDEETDRKMSQIQDRITSTLASDYVAYQSATATTKPEKLPNTALGVPYNSVEYLQKLATQIQAAHGVLPNVVSIADRWLPADELAKLPGIGTATRAHPVQPLPMPVYLISFSSAFVAPENQNHPDVIQEFEPTRPMRDAADTIYIARVSATDPSHKPASLAEVETQVRSDVITKAAYELARADAVKLRDQAKQSDLKSAAAGKPLITIGPFTREPGPSVPGLTLSGQSVNDFREKAFKLLSTATSKPNAKPVDLIELHRDGRVLVAELTNVQAMWMQRTRAMEEAQVAEEVGRQFQERFSRDWFNYDAVATRLHYVPEGDGSPRETPAAPPPPRAPIF